MSKLAEMTFKPIITKEFEVMGKKILLRTLTTKDTLELDLNSQTEKPNLKDLLSFGVDTLSHCIVSVDGVTPDSVAECKEFLLKQDQGVVIQILNKYQSMLTDASAEIKN